MSGSTVDFEKAVGDAAANAGEPQRREQSSIAFPYLDLDAAVEVARAVYNRGGHGSCDLDELAAEMGQTVSGAFRLKTGTAKTFDLTEKDGRSGVKLSELGRQVIAPDTERAARAEAFLRVPLYAAVYDKYKGHLLPPAKALEREMLGLGVSSKQTDKARQAFERSARQAGYFDSGDDRLVRPRGDLPTRRADEQQVERSESRQQEKPRDERQRENGGGGGGLPPMHPFIKGLLDTLPPPGDDWSVSARADWLQTAASIFKLIYKGDGSISVAVA